MSKFCVNAAAALRTTNEGRCNICCMSSQLLRKDDGKFFYVDHDSIADIWNSNSRNKIDDDLRHGIEHPNCDRCWDEERAGHISKRMRDNETYQMLVNIQETYDAPKFMEFNLGNFCNIKCRTCGPWASSKWAEEFGLMTDQDPGDLIKRYSKSYSDDSIFWDNLEDLLPHLTYMDFYGGEPFLVKKQWKIMQQAVDLGYSKDIGVHYNTNGTIWDSKKVLVLKEFKHVKIDFSIDGVGDRFELMRHPAKWEPILENLKSAKEFLGHDMAICHTVSILNIYYVDEMMKWATDRNILMYLNLLHDPKYFNIQNMPDYLKAIVNEKLKRYCKQHYSGYHSLSGVLNFMNNKSYDKDEWRKFFKETDRRDKFRNESYKDTFSEFWDHIK